MMIERTHVKGHHYGCVVTDIERFPRLFFYFSPGGVFAAVARCIGAGAV